MSHEGSTLKVTRAPSPTTAPRCRLTGLAVREPVRTHGSRFAS